jgi:RimJ/RimL family protein N-acetyltransferase
MTTTKRQTREFDFIINAGRAVLRRLGLSWVAAIRYEHGLSHESILNVTAKIPVEVVIGTPTHIDMARGLFPEQKLEQFRQRLADGKMWILALAEGKVVYSTWLTFQDEYEPNLGIWVKLVPGEAYNFNSYTIPGFEGLGLYTLCLTHVMKYSAKNGAQKLLGLVFPDNRAVRSVMKKLGFREKELITRVSFFKWSRLTKKKLYRSGEQI